MGTFTITVITLPTFMSEKIGLPIKTLLSGLHNRKMARQYMTVEHEQYQLYFQVTTFIPAFVVTCILGYIFLCGRNSLLFYST